jgi:hypothetical protein
MNSDANPLDYLIECCEKSISTGYWTLTKFNILNAKDELKRLREKSKIYDNVAWANINKRGDLFNLTLHYNRFNEENCIPLYANKEELKKLLDKSR